MANEIKRSGKIRLYKDKGDLNKDSLALLDKFKVYLTLRQSSPGTILNYESDLLNWFGFIEKFQGDKYALDASDEDIEEFLAYCQSKGNNTERIKRRASSISSLFLFARKKKITKEDPMSMIDRPKRSRGVVVKTFLTKDQVFEIKEILFKQSDFRKYAYFVLSLDTMARVEAVSSIKWEQIDFENLCICDVPEKEGYIVDLYFVEETAEVLKNLREYYIEKDMLGDHVFVSRRKGQIEGVTSNTLFKWAKSIGSMCGIPSLHPHDFRHSGSQLLKLEGCPIEDISSLLNHKGLDVTRKHYLKEDANEIRRKKQQFNYISNNTMDTR